MSKQDEWSVIQSLLPPGWEDKARELGALERSRGIKTPDTLLRALLALAANEGGTRTAAAALSAAEIVDVSGEALRKRLGNAGPWLSWIAQGLTQQFRDTSELNSGELRPRAIDSTTIQSPTAVGTDFRLHYTIDLTTLSCDWHELTDAKGAESLERVPVKTGDLLIGDRNFLRSAPAQTVTKAGAFVLIRLRSNHDPMTDHAGRPFDALAHAESVKVGSPREWSVRISVKNGEPVEGRVIIVRLPAPVAHKSEKRARQKAQRKQRRPGKRALSAAKFFMVFTTVPASRLSMKQVLQLYRFRWQIELAFKRLKQILRLGHLPHRKPVNGEAWILAKLVLALLLETIYRNERSFSPWGYDLTKVSA